MLVQEITRTIPKCVRESRLHFIVNQNSADLTPLTKVKDSLLVICRFRQFYYNNKK